MPSLTNGGAERVAANLSLALSQHYETIIAVSDAGRGIDYTHGGCLVDLETPVSHSFFGKLWTFGIRLSRVRRLKRERTPDVSISLLEGPNFLNLLSRRADRVIVSVRNNRGAASRRPSLTDRLHGWLMRPLYGHADAVVALSQGVGITLVERFGIDENKIRVIYNPLDADAVREQAAEPLPEEFCFLAKAPVVVSTGRLTKQKGQWHLLRAFRRVKDAEPGARLVVLGDGPLREYLVGLSRSLGLRTYVACETAKQSAEEADVYFLGFQLNPFRYLACASIFAFPSLWEGLGNAVLEALALGVPVVASDCRYGPREILDPESDVRRQTAEPERAAFGILMPVCDGRRREAGVPLAPEEQAWSQTLIELLSDVPGHAAYASAGLVRAADFAPERILAEWKALIL